MSSADGMKNKVSVLSLGRRYSKLIRGIEDAAYFFLESLDKDLVSVEIYLVGNTKMRELNRIHRSKDKPTNVLAFGVPRNFPNLEGDFINIGEVYICPSYIKKHKEDINYLLLHGLLHLFGFNHENKSDRIKMEMLENKLMRWLNQRS